MNPNNPYSYDQHHQDKDPYNLMEYDLVIIILKEGCNKDDCIHSYIKLDQKKNKYFLKGRVEQLMIGNISSVRFLPEKNFKAYKEAKKVDDRQKLTINIRYAIIDYIMLPFDSFDWKK